MPWCCADCGFVPFEFEAYPRPCGRCGGLAFRRGESLLTVKVTPRMLTPGPLVSAHLAGLTARDRQFLQVCKLGW